MVNICIVHNTQVKLRPFRLHMRIGQWASHLCMVIITLYKHQRVSFFKFCGWPCFKKTKKGGWQICNFCVIGYLPKGRLKSVYLHVGTDRRKTPRRIHKGTCLWGSSSLCTLRRSCMGSVCRDLGLKVNFMCSSQFKTCNHY